MSTEKIEIVRNFYTEQEYAEEGMSDYIVGYQQYVDGVLFRESGIITEFYTEQKYSVKSVLERQLISDETVVGSKPVDAPKKPPVMEMAPEVKKEETPPPPKKKKSIGDRISSIDSGDFL